MSDKVKFSRLLLCWFLHWSWGYPWQHTESTVCLSTSRGLSYTALSHWKFPQESFNQYKFIFIFNHFSCSTFLYYWDLWAFKPGKGWFETRAVPRSMVDHGTPSNRGQPVKAALEQLCSGTYSHAHIPGLLQKLEKTCSPLTTQPWLQKGYVTLQLGWERSTGSAAGHEGSADKWSGQTTLACENAWGQQGDVQSTTPASAQSSAHPQTMSICPTGKRGWHHLLASFTPCPPAPSAAWRWCSHCWNWKSYGSSQ